MLQTRFWIVGILVLGFAVPAVTAPVPRNESRERLAGRWKLVRAYFGSSRNPEHGFEGIQGIDLVYEFYRDGRLELRSEFAWSDPAVRRGFFWVDGHKIMHTAQWKSDGHTRVMVVEELTADKLRVREDDGIAREFSFVPSPRR